MGIPRSRVPITLGGKTRTIVLNFNALCDAELALGRDIFNEELTVSSPSVIRVLLWAGLKHEWPNVTVDMIGDMLEADGSFISASIAIAQALEAALPDEDETPPSGEEAGAEGNATGSQ